MTATATSSAPPVQAPVDAARRARTGAPAPATIMAGESALALLSGALLYSAPDPAEFRCSIRRAVLGDALVEILDATAHGTVRSPCHEPAEEESVELTFLRRGSLVLRHGTAPDLGAGDAVRGCGDDPLEYTAGSAVRLIRLGVPVRRLPDRCRTAARSDAAPLMRTTLLACTGAFLDQLVPGAAGLTDVGAARIGRVLVDLASQLMIEAAGVPPTPREALRARIVDHVEDNLADAALSPPTIAAAFNISLRSVHLAFDDAEVTLARHIRRRRVLAVIDALHAGSPLPAAALAAEHGFTGRDQLSRAFRQETGDTLEAFRSAVRDGSRRGRG